MSQKPPGLVLFSFLVLAIFVSGNNVFATTFKAVPDAVKAAAPVPHCTVTAKFVRETFEDETLSVRGRQRRENIVRWIFETVEKPRAVENGRCPEGPRFELTVRGAIHGVDPETGRDLYSYMPGMDGPPAGIVVMRLVNVKNVYGPGGRQHDEWRMLDGKSPKAGAPG